MMTLALPRFDRLLITTALMGAALCVAHPAHAAFDPYADATANGPATAISTQRLPDTGVLSNDMPTRPLYSSGTAATAPAVGSPAGYASPLAPIQMPRPLYPTRAGVAPAPQPIAVPTQVRAIEPIQTPATVAAAAATKGTIAPLPSLSAPAPVVASPIVTAPVVVATPTVQPIVLTEPKVAVVPMPNLPPVDAATAARAEAILKAEAKAAPAPKPAVVAAPVVVAEPMPIAVAAPSTGFIAPAPLIAQTPVVAKPVVVPERIGAMPANLPAPKPVVVATAPQPVDDISSVVVPDLSSQSREVLGKVPSRMDSPKVVAAQRVKLDRVSPQIQEVLGKEAQEENYESVGLSIKVRRPGLDTNYELNNAYQSLMGGDTTRAIAIYKEILSVEPRNEDALFGLAATYHRLGLENQARPFYANLLKINPNHREALNNFLVLVSNESPEDALPELERLELRNPDFSPIPAQIAIVYDKLGYPDQAREKMIRAIELAPENLTYKYNLAIMLDRQKQYADAVALYRLLIQAAMNGEQVPASVESMEKRLNYITTAATSGRLGS